ncbi:hypothetical protein AVV30_gp107 [Vibrio phage phi 1]|uniref:Uncharacterized protein n=1 Tax=Vibrio phage phi 1 TaxID=1589297 RepID=A0A0B5HE35_9CAUD|nr:hypothetical protein AVV30_gp107 [Vibrio phage phi 1]AJF40765.1 hypothetical protein SBVP1_0107 [Vibrio phage phi 1]
MQLIGNYTSDTKVCIWIPYRTDHYGFRFNKTLITHLTFRATQVSSDLFEYWLDSKSIYKPTKEEWKEICS